MTTWKVSLGCESGMSSEQCWLLSAKTAMTCKRSQVFFSAMLAIFLTYFEPCTDLYTRVLDFLVQSSSIRYLRVRKVLLEIGCFGRIWEWTCWLADSKPTAFNSCISLRLTVSASMFLLAPKLAYSGRFWNGLGQGNCKIVVDSK